jgi:hypothetical protein
LSLKLDDNNAWTSIRDKRKEEFNSAINTVKSHVSLSWNGQTREDNLQHNMEQWTTQNKGATAGVMRDRAAQIGHAMDPRMTATSIVYDNMAGDKASYVKCLNCWHWIGGSSGRSFVVYWVPNGRGIKNPDQKNAYWDSHHLHNDNASTLSWYLLSHHCI